MPEDPKSSSSPLTRLMADASKAARPLGSRREAVVDSLPCGCTVEGGGTLRDPLRPKLCEKHVAAPSRQTVLAATVSRATTVEDELRDWAERRAAEVVGTSSAKRPYELEVLADVRDAILDGVRQAVARMESLVGSYIVYELGPPLAKDATAEGGPYLRSYAVEQLRCTGCGMPSKGTGATKTVRRAGELHFRLHERFCEQCGSSWYVSTGILTSAGEPVPEPIDPSPGRNAPPPLYVTGMVPDGRVEPTPRRSTQGSALAEWAIIVALVSLLAIPLALTAARFVGRVQNGLDATLGEPPAAAGRAWGSSWEPSAASLRPPSPLTGLDAVHMDPPPPEALWPPAAAAGGDG